MAELLRELVRDWPDLEWGSYPEQVDGGWQVRLVVRGFDPDRVAAGLDALRSRLAARGRRC